MGDGVAATAEGQSFPAGLLTAQTSPEQARRQVDEFAAGRRYMVLIDGLTPQAEEAALEEGHKLKIPAGTQSGTVLRIKGKGIVRRVRSGRGDQLVEVTVEVPTVLTARQRDLLEELAKELGAEVQPQQKSFVQKLKEFFG